MSDVNYDDDASRQSNAQRFAQRARQNVICLALRAAAQLFVTANNASWPNFRLIAMIRIVIMLQLSSVIFGMTVSVNYRSKRALIWVRL
jgi:hypothetical protein